MSFSKMSSSEGLFTHRDNKPDESYDTDKDADNDLELLVEPVFKNKQRKSFIVYKFPEFKVVPKKRKADLVTEKRTSKRLKKE